MIKDLRYVKINSVSPLYFIIGTVYGYIEKRDKNKHLKQVPTDKSKSTQKKYEGLWSKSKI